MPPRTRGGGASVPASVRLQQPATSTPSGLGEPAGDHRLLSRTILPLCLVPSIFLVIFIIDQLTPGHLAHRGPVLGKVRERLLNGSKWGKWVQGLYSQTLSKGAWCQAVNKEAGRMSPGPAG